MDTLRIQNTSASLSRLRMARKNKGKKGIGCRRLILNCVSEFSDGKSSVTVTRSGDEQFVIVPVLPTSINGMSITVYKAGDILVERTSNKAITFKRMTITAVRI